MQLNEWRDGNVRVQLRQTASNCKYVRIYRAGFFSHGDLELQHDAVNNY